MQILMKFFAGVNTITNEKKTTIEFEGKNSINMHDLIVKLLDKYGESLEEVMFRKISKNDITKFKKNEIDLEIKELLFSINGKLYKYNKEIKIEDGAIMAMFPPLGGG